LSYLDTADGDGKAEYTWTAVITPERGSADCAGQLLAALSR
jgi:hypothetical protein